jgi:hypothetical protein
LDYFYGGRDEQFQEKLSLGVGARPKKNDQHQMGS